MSTEGGGHWTHTCCLAVKLHLQLALKGAALNARVEDFETSSGSMWTQPGALVPILSDVTIGQEE